MPPFVQNSFLPFIFVLFCFLIIFLTLVCPLFHPSFALNSQIFSLLISHLCIFHYFKQLLLLFLFSSLHLDITTVYCLSSKSLNFYTSFLSVFLDLIVLEIFSASGAASAAIQPLSLQRDFSSAIGTEIYY